MSKNERNAILGVIGGVLFMTGDCLLYVFPGRDPAADIDPVFASMPVWRFMLSAFLGLIGMAFMLFGFQSLYSMTKNVCGRVMQCLMIIGGFGVAGTALAHFNLGSLMPFIYKAVLLSGGDEVLAENACATVADWAMPLDLLIIIALYMQFVVLAYMVLSGKSGLGRWFILISPIGAVALGVLWSLVFKGTAIGGAWGSCESLGEGLMYLTAFYYWRRISHPN